MNAIRINVKIDINIDFEKIYEAAKEAFIKFFNWSNRQLAELWKWMLNNPEKVAMIVIAAARATSGDISSLIDVGMMVLGVAVG